MELKEKLLYQFDVDTIKAKAKENLLNELVEQHNNIISQINDNNINIEILHLKSQHGLINPKDKQNEIKKLNEEIENLQVDLDEIKDTLNVFRNFNISDDDEEYEPIKNLDSIQL